jgi:hypothetical protein
MHRLPSPLSDSILKKDTLGLEALALEDIRLLAVEAASEAVCFPLFVEALRIAVQLTFFADLTTVEQSTRNLGSALRPHVRRVWGAAAPDEVAAILEAVADAAARHEDYDGPEIQIERSRDTKVQFELEFPKTREEADLVMMGLRAKAEVAQRRLHSLQLRQAASAIRHGYEDRRSAERRAAEGRGTVPADRMRLHGLRFIQGLVGAAPQIALIRGAVADFTADPTAGLLPVLRLGRVMRIPKAALTRWIEKNTRYDEIDDRTSTEAGAPAPKPQGRTSALPPTRRPVVTHRRDASAGGQEAAPVGLRRLAS